MSRVAISCEDAKYESKQLYFASDFEARSLLSSVFEACLLLCMSTYDCSSSSMPLGMPLLLADSADCSSLCLIISLLLACLSLKLLHREFTSFRSFTPSPSLCYGGSKMCPSRLILFISSFIQGVVATWGSSFCLLVNTTRCPLFYS